MTDGIMARFGGLAAPRRQDRLITRERYRLETPSDVRRDRRDRMKAELLPVVSAAFELAGLSPDALVVIGPPVFLVMSPAGQLVSELWPNPHRPHWRATRYGDGTSLETASGPLEALVERIAEWVATSQQVTASQPRRPLPLSGGGDPAPGPSAPATPSPAPPTPAAPAPPAPSPTAPTPTAPTPTVPTPTVPTPTELPRFLVTSPTYSLVAELWHDPDRPHWHATRHENGRTREAAAGTLGRLAERIAQWAPLRSVR